jgi:selenide,water dikinase
VPLKPLERSIHSATDITGFGFIGHAWEMAAASRVSLRFDHKSFEFLEGSLECARKGHLAAGLKKNREFIGECLRFAPDIPDDVQQILFDPQTSGGLLVAVDPDSADAARKLLTEKGCSCMRVGEVIEQTSPLLEVC